MKRYRWRTWLRSHLPWWLVNLGVAPKGKRDCGDHDWHRYDETTALCYHCEVGEHPLGAGDVVTAHGIVKAGPVVNITIHSDPMGIVKVVRAEIAQIARQANRSP